jgi:2-methylcitrate dehydratase PrpD
VGGNFSGTVAAARVLGLGEERMLSALGLAGCQASGLLAWVTEPAQFSKSFQIGAASRNGVAAALLAEASFIGPPHILEGNHNVFFAFSGLAPTGELTRELGARFEIARTSFKKYACCRQIHAPLDGLFKILSEQGLGAEDLASITTRVASSMADIIDGNELPSHNAQYVLAVAALDGKVELEQLAGERAADPKVVALAQRVRVAGDAELEKLFPEQWSGITTVTTRAGQEFTEAVYYPKGDPENPLTEDELRSKFMGLATKAVSAPRAEEIMRAVGSLEEMRDVSELMRLFAT